MKNMSIDREKATKGLRLCMNHLEIGSGFCDKCPYFHEKGCRFHMAEDVYKLLKMQEPRLLTLTELLNAKNIDVYLEETCETQTHPLLLVETENESRNQAAFFWPSVVRPLKSYGKTWRCWTSRPTDEQREAAPWQ